MSKPSRPNPNERGCIKPVSHQKMETVAHLRMSGARVKETAEKTGVSEATIRRWERSNKEYTEIQNQYRMSFRNKLVNTATREYGEVLECMLRGAKEDPRLAFDFLKATGFLATAAMETGMAQDVSASGGTVSITLNLAQGDTEVTTTDARIVEHETEDVNEDT